jgi:hypothetical protein
VRIDGTERLVVAAAASPPASVGDVDVAPDGKVTYWGEDTRIMAVVLPP